MFIGPKLAHLQKKRISFYFQILLVFLSLEIQKIKAQSISPQIEMPSLEISNYSFYSYGQSVGIHENYGTAGILFSLDSRPFIDLILFDWRLHFLDDHRIGLSSGLALRMTGPNEHAIDGINFYYDGLEGMFRRFHQIGIGFEKVSNTYAFQTNFYFPFKQRVKNGPVTIFNDYDNTGLEIPYEAKAKIKEFAYTGFDAEFGLNHWTNYFYCYGGLGTYYFVRKPFVNVCGVKCRARVEISRFLALEGQITWDKQHHTLGRGKIELRVPFELICECIRCTACFTKPIRPIFRDDLIHLNRCCEYKTNF